MPAKPKPAAPEPVPAFTGDRMLLLGPLVTPRVLTLARMRLLHRDSLMKGKEIIAGCDRETLKVVYLIVMMMNPHERLRVEEEGVLRSMDSDNINSHKKEGLIGAL